MGVVAGMPIGSPTCGLSLGVLVGMLNGSLMPGMPGGMLGSAGAGGGCGMSGVGSSGIGCSSGMSNASRNVPVPSLTPEQLIRINDPCSKSSKSRGGEGGGGLQFAPNQLSLKPHEIPQFTPKSLKALNRQQPFNQWVLGSSPSPLTNDF